MEKLRYIFWSRQQLFSLMKGQALLNNYDLDLLKEAVFDERWNPIEDFNGCNFVQDDYHPFLPCFIHDWRWICFKYDKKFDKEFETNLRAFGFSKLRAKMYFLGVRLGWLLYYKYKK